MTLRRFGQSGFRAANTAWQFYAFDREKQLGLIPLPVVAWLRGLIRCAALPGKSSIR